MLSKIVNFVKTHEAKVVLVIGVALISLLSFAMGYIVAKNYGKEPIKIENENSYHRSGDNGIVSCVEVVGARS